jgi:hypothetical protein
MMAGSKLFWTLMALYMMSVTAARNATLPAKSAGAFARLESQPGMMMSLRSRAAPSPSEQELPVAVETRPKRSIKSFFNWYRRQWKENASSTKGLTLIGYVLGVDFIRPKIKAIWGNRVFAVFDWVYLLPIFYVVATETVRLRSEKNEETAVDPEATVK